MLTKKNLNLNLYIYKLKLLRSRTVQQSDAIEGLKLNEMYFGI